MYKSQCACPCGQHGLGKDWHIISNFSKSSQAILHSWDRESSLERLSGRGRLFFTELTMRTKRGDTKHADEKAVVYRKVPKCEQFCERWQAGWGSQEAFAPKWPIFEGFSPLLPHAMKRAPVLSPSQHFSNMCQSEFNGGIIKMQISGSHS